VLDEGTFVKATTDLAFLAKSGKKSKKVGSVALRPYAVTRIARLRRSMPLLLGCIADDLTGATDLANTLARRGMSVVQTIGVSGAGHRLAGCGSHRVALKSRTIPAKEAVALSLQACRWLKTAGARQFYFKYCSTFRFDRSGQYRSGRRCFGRGAGCGSDHGLSGLSRRPGARSISAISFVGRDLLSIRRCGTIR
jgi:hypothetical protein